MKNKNKKNQLIKIFAFCITFIIILISASIYLSNYAISRSRGNDDRNSFVSSKVESSIVLENKENQKLQTNNFLKNNRYKKVKITSFDNLQLVGYEYKNNSSNWVILIHGYRRDHTEVLKYAPYYYEKGFNLLLVDLRASGESEGKYIGMGYLDSIDMLDWIDYIIKNNKNANIVLHGESMGAATVMMLSDKILPSNVKALIEDCGYTSCYDIFKSELKVRFNLPAFPLLDIASIITKICAGYSIKEASAVKAVKNSTIPIIFIHGTNDDFVPFSSLDVLYNAKEKGDKEKLIAEGAGHTEALFTLGEKYFENIFLFLNKYLQ